MGMEYKLEFDSGDAKVMQSLCNLRSAALVSDDMIEFREDGSESGMPDATIRLESSGAYFCDHGGFGRSILGIVVANLVSLCDSVTVRDYE